MISLIKIWVPRLEGLFPGALDGVAVLNYIDIVFIIGKQFRISISDPNIKYSPT